MSALSIQCRIDSSKIDEPKRVPCRFLVFLFGVGVSGSLILWAGLFDGQLRIIIALCSILIFAVSVAGSIRFDLSHPFVWFNFSFVLYSISNSVLGILGFSDLDLITYKALLCCYIAMAGFSLGVGLNVGGATNTYKSKISNELARGVPLVIVIISAILLVHFVYLYGQGLSNKYDRNLLDSPLAKLNFGFNIFITCISVYFVKTFQENGKLPKVAVLGTFTCAFLALIFSGERDVFFRYFIVSFIIYVMLKQPRKIWFFVICAAPLLLYVLTIFAKLKMFAITGEIRWEDSKEGLNLITLFLRGELCSQGRTLEILLNHVPEFYDFKFGVGFLNDLTRAFVPGFVLKHGMVQSTGSWFCKTFFPALFERGGGVGFTMVGVGYLNFGIPGIIVLFFFLGHIAKEFYNYAKKSAVGLVIYANMVPVYLYSIRSDLAVPVSQSFKHILLPIIVMTGIGVFLKGSAKR